MSATLSRPSAVTRSQLIPAFGRKVVATYPGLWSQGGRKVVAKCLQSGCKVVATYPALCSQDVRNLSRPSATILKIIIVKCFVLFVCLKQNTALFVAGAPLYDTALVVSETKQLRLAPSAPKEGNVCARIS